MSHYAHFDLDIPKALKCQLVNAFEELVPGRLSEVATLGAPDAPGVYGLFHGGVLVYVGKAWRLRQRLVEHRTKIEGRQHISASEVGFVCLTVNRNWSAYAPEDLLIRHNRPRVEWKRFRQP